jgi:hypothetical protein
MPGVKFNTPQIRRIAHFLPDSRKGNANTAHTDVGPNQIHILYLPGNQQPGEGAPDAVGHFNSLIFLPLSQDHSFYQDDGPDTISTKSPP